MIDGQWSEVNGYRAEWAGYEPDWAGPGPGQPGHMSGAGLETWPSWALRVLGPWGWLMVDCSL